MAELVEHISRLITHLDGVEVCTSRSLKRAVGEIMAPMQR